MKEWMAEFKKYLTNGYPVLESIVFKNGPRLDINRVTGF
jgi:hypothetical protein